MAMQERENHSLAQAALAEARGSQPQILFFDADDTLWENNIYFERAIVAFISFLDHRTHTREEVREHLNACEHATIAEHGYGLRSFRLSLVRCFEDLAGTPVTPEVHQKVVAFTEAIADAEIELLPGVPETLAELGARHRLLLVTKGVDEEQLGKLRRSGLRNFFSAAEVVAEKTASEYRRLLAAHGCGPGRTWMIGNSPKSDINPALAAGLNAVFIPHDFTWTLEHEALDVPPPGQTLLELRGFRELLQHF